MAIIQTERLTKRFGQHTVLGGIDLSMDSQGNVLIYEEHGNTAVSINPTTGAATLRAVERQPDGSMLLKPGEIINRQAADVMRALGEEATRSLVGPHWNIRPNFEPGLRRGGGGDSGGSGPNIRLERLNNRENNSAPTPPRAPR